MNEKQMRNSEKANTKNALIRSKERRGKYEKNNNNKLKSN